MVHLKKMTKLGNTIMIALAVIAAGYIHYYFTGDAELAPTTEQVAPSVPTVSAEEAARLDALELYRFIRWSYEKGNDTKCRTRVEIETMLAKTGIRTLKELESDPSASAEEIRLSCYEFATRIYNMWPQSNDFGANVFGSLGYPIPKEVDSSERRTHEEMLVSCRAASAKRLYERHRWDSRLESIYASREELRIGLRKNGDPIPDEVYNKQTVLDVEAGMKRRGALVEDASRVAEWYLQRHLKMKQDQ